MSQEQKDEENDSNLQIKKEKTMNLSIMEGSFAAFSQAIGDNFIIPFGLSLNATPSEIGILTSMYGLISPVGQIAGSRIMEKRSRKQVLTTSAIIQGLMWIPIIFLSILFFNNIFVLYLPFLLIIFYSFFSFTGGITGSTWFSLMGDIVPEDKRGRYFAKRNLIAGFFSLAATFITAFLLDYLANFGMVLWGFFIIFIIASACRIISGLSFQKHYFPSYIFQETYHVSIKQFFKELPKENFGHFSIFVTLIYFGLSIASPFFMVYMITDLGFSYTLAIIINLSMSFMALFFFPIAGRISDNKGNVFLLRIGAIMIPFLPVMWLISPNPFFLIFVVQLTSGIGWTSFNLAASNFIYDNIPNEKVAYYISYYNFLMSIGIFAGGITGSLIIAFVPIYFINQFLFLFLLSGIIRAVIVILFLPRIKEVRIPPGIKRVKPILQFRPSSISRRFFHISGIKKRIKNHKERKNNKNNKK